MVHYEVECENLFTDQNEKHDLYFHLTEAEIATLNIAADNQYMAYKEGEVSNKKNIELFEKLIEKAYGQKTPDGKFIKDEEEKKAFLCSPAYSAFLMKFINEEISINDFVLGCLPKSVSKKINIGTDGKVSIKEE